MRDEVLVAILSKLVEERLSALPLPVNGRRGTPGRNGADGLDGKDFDINEHGETIRQWAKEYALKFEDLSAEQIGALRGPSGRDGKDGSGFDFEASRSEIESSIRSVVSELSPELKLRFSDLSDGERDSLKGRAGRDGRDGRDFNFDDHREFFEGLKPKFSDFTAEERESLSLHFRDLTAEEREALKLKFVDLSFEEKQEIRGARGKPGQRGLAGRDGVDGVNGKDGRDGKTLRGLPGPRGFVGRDGRKGEDGQDAPFIVDIEVDEHSNDRCSFIFYFSDGSKRETNTFELPKSSSSGGVGYLYSSGTAGAGSGVPGADGKSAYEIALENGFVGTEVQWLDSLVGPAGSGGGSDTEYYDDGDLIGTTGKINFVGSGVSATEIGDEITVMIPGVAASQMLLNTACDTDVHVGSAVRMSILGDAMSEWPNLADVLHLTDNQAVAVNALADTWDNSNVIGIVESKITSTTCNIRFMGVTPAHYASLLVTEDYYLSDTTPGGIVKLSGAPSTPGHILVRVGQPVDANKLLYVRGERLVLT